jgi:pimeloyl-ACP methyl ester carboxylesterase
MARAIAASIPGALFELIPDAAHLSVLEQPDIFNTHLKTFLGLSERSAS